VHDPDEALPPPDPNRPYNPLEKRSLAESIVRALLAQPAVGLPPPKAFVGAGIYAIYYSGAFPLYRPLSVANLGGPSVPIYVGKAVAEGSRKGGFSVDKSAGPVLIKRLKEHATSINQAENLDLADFKCKYLVVDDFWIGLAESLLIENFAPLWNRAIDGFGNHDQGKTRSTQRKSPWDALHPGRSWAVRMPDPGLSHERLERIVGEGLRHLKGHEE